MILDENGKEIQQDKPHPFGDFSKSKDVKINGSVQGSGQGKRLCWYYLVDGDRVKTRMKGDMK